MCYFRTIKKSFLRPYFMFIFINSRTRFILLDTIIHLISFPTYNTFFSSPSFNSELGSRMWEVKFALVKDGRDLISLNIITIELCLVLPTVFFIYGSDCFVYTFQTKTFLFVWAFDSFTTSVCSWHVLNLLLEFAMILENGMGKISTTDSGRIFH